MDRHLKTAQPDAFVVYLSGLLLGRLAPIDSNLDVLHSRTRSSADGAVKVVAHLAIKHLRALHGSADPGVAGTRLRASV
jgi:hypothetical protein